MLGKLYEVWWSKGTGLQPGPRFRLLEDARRYVEAHQDEASYAVRSPDGTWALIAARDGAAARHAAS